MLRWMIARVALPRERVGGALVAIGLCWVMALAPLAAHAQESSPQALARAHFERGLERANAEAWVEALEAFRASLAALDRPATHLNVGAALLRLGRHIEARQEMETLLATGMLGDSERTQAQVIRDHAVAGIRRIDVALEPSSGTVFVDGAARAITNGQLELDPGRHTIEVRADGFATQTRELGPDDRAMIVRLRATPARLRVLSTIESARIVLDGEERGSGTFDAEVDAGRHQLEVSAEGHETFERWLTLAPAQELEVLAQLVARRDENVLESPWFWGIGGVTLAVVAGVAIGLGVGLTSGGLDGGTIGDVLRPR